MQARYHLLALAIAVALAAPVAFAQRQIFDGVVGQVPTVGVTSRVYTNATLRTPTGDVIGKVKTATVQSDTRGIVQGLRVQVTGLTPGAEYALVIDNTLVGTGTVSASGVLRLRFIAPSNGRTPALPEAVTPIATAQVVQLYAVVGQQLVASGQFSVEGR